MANILVSGPIIKYPWGGLMQYWLAWLVGIKNNGHQVYYIEDSQWEGACYDVPRRTMGDDPSYGIGFLTRELAPHGLDRNWCYVDYQGRHYGMSDTGFRATVERADLLIDLEFDTLMPGLDNVPMRVYVDGDPGWIQHRVKKELLDAGKPLPQYHRHFTLGFNIGTPKAKAPDLGLVWHHTHPPVLIDGRPVPPADPRAPFTTVLKWQANHTFEYEGVVFGMKDREFDKFADLPSRVDDVMEIAASGPNVPKGRIRDLGWSLKSADDITTSIDNYRNYIAGSKGEFTFVKNAFVETHCGMFLERSGYYMQSGRPVVLQDNGWSEHLPSGEGLFAVNCLEEAVAAIHAINDDYPKHCRRAREIVHDCLDATKVVGNVLRRIGV